MGDDYCRGRNEASGWTDPRSRMRLQFTPALDRAASAPQMIACLTVTATRAPTRPRATLRRAVSLQYSKAAGCRKRTTPRRRWPFKPPRREAHATRISSNAVMDPPDRVSKFSLSLFSDSDNVAPPMARPAQSQEPIFESVALLSCSVRLMLGWLHIQ